MNVTLSSEVRVNYYFFLSLFGSDLMRRSRTGTQVRKRSASFRKVARQKKIEEQKDKEVEREGQWREKGGEEGRRRCEGEGKKGGKWGGEGEEGERREKREGISRKTERG